MFSLSLDFIQVNSLFEYTTGFTNEEVAGKSITEVAKYTQSKHGASNEDFYAENRDIVDSSFFILHRLPANTSIDVPFKSVSKSGMLIIGTSKHTLVRDSAGRPLHYLCLMLKDHLRFTNTTGNDNKNDNDNVK